MSRFKKNRRKQHLKSIRGMAVAVAVASDKKLSSDPKFRALSDEYFSALSDVLQAGSEILFGVRRLKHQLSKGGRS